MESSAAASHSVSTRAISGSSSSESTKVTEKQKFELKEDITRKITMAFLIAAIVLFVAGCIVGMMVAGPTCLALFAAGAVSSGLAFIASKVSDSFEAKALEFQEE